VEHRALGTRQRGVGDVANQVMAEPEPAGSDGQALLHERLLRQLDERRRRGLAEQVVERLLKEARPEDRGVLKGALLGRRQQVQPRRDRGLHRVGKLVGGATPALDDRLRHLLSEERIASGRLGYAARELPVRRRQERRGELVRRFGCQRAQLDLRHVACRAAEVGTALEQLGPTGAQHHQRDVVQPEHDLLDQVEQPVVGQMGVVDPDHQRTLAREQRDQSPPRPLQLILDVPVARLAAQRGRQRPREFVPVLGPEPFEPGGERVVDARDGVVRPRARGGAQDLAERPERDPAPVRRVAAQQGLRRRIGRRQPLRHLAREPGLADAGVAGDRDQLRDPVPRGPPVDQLEQRHVVVAADERRARPDPLGAGALGPPRWKRVGKALRVDRIGLPNVGGPACPGGALADEDLAGCGGLLQPGGGVHRLAGDRQVATAIGGEDLAGLDPHPHGQALIHGAHPLHEREPRGHGSIRIVAVRAGNAEHGHDRVADVLLDRATVLLEGRAGDLEERREPPSQLLGIEVGRQLRRPDEVGEDHRRELPLRARERTERGPARGAEARVVAGRGTTTSTRLRHGLTIPTRLPDGVSRTAGRRRQTGACLHRGRVPLAPGARG
jgi:hypothetical protein